MDEKALSMPDNIVYHLTQWKIVFFACVFEWLL